MRGFPSVERLLRWVYSLSSVVLFVWRVFFEWVRSDKKERVGCKYDWYFWF